MIRPLLPTTVVGSYVQPEWLVDRANLKKRLPPRVRAKEIWRIPEEHLAFGKLQAMVRGAQIVRIELTRE